ncbi:MAG: MATE family efflux transporter, partial [Oscillospiraceae bacterium]|nr:MATE family efflux transporter [Oscillospiraceae bacterium]
LTVVLGAAVNLVLDPLFIFVLDQGIRGAAMATVLAQGCSAVWVVKFLTGKKAILRLRLGNMVLSWRRVGRIVSLGLSGFFMSLTNSLVQVVCNKTLQAYGGDLYVSIMTILNSLREVVFMILQGLNNGAQPVIGYNYGAGQPERVRRAIHFSVGMVLGSALVMWAALMLLPGPLIRLFNGDAEIVEHGVIALRIYFCLFPFQALQNAGQTVFVSLGKSKQAVFFSLLRKAFINAPLTVLLPMLGLGATGVFVAESSSQLLGGLACFLTMYITVYRPLCRRQEP